MAFMQNYGRGLNKINQGSRMQGAAMLAQSFQNVGQSVATAMNDYQAKKEQKEKKQQLAKFYEGQFAANPKVAAQIGIDVNDPKSLAQGSMAAAENPEGMRFAMGLQQMQAQNQQMQLARESAGREKAAFPLKMAGLGQSITGEQQRQEVVANDTAYQKQLRPSIVQSTQSQAELNKMKLAEAKEDQQISNLAAQMVQQDDGSFRIPEPLASSPVAMKALQLRQEQDRKARATEAETRNLISLADSRDAQVKLMQDPKLTTLDTRKELEAINKHREQIEKQPVEITGEAPMTFGDLIKLQQSEDSKDQKKWKRLQNKLLKSDGSYQDAYAIPFHTWKQTIVAGNNINKGTMVDVIVPDDEDAKPTEPKLLPYQVYEKEQKEKKRDKFLEAMSDYPEDYQTYGTGM
jgi:hypothetical protein